MRVSGVLLLLLALGHLVIMHLLNNVGEINYRHIFALLDELNYHGWVGCEYRPLGSTSAGLGWMKTLRSPG